ncbi:MAG: patatin-like phospholipase family protein [candidate division WOR-3 bacterium]
MRRIVFGFLIAGWVLAEPVRIGLALSGGAALGLAHIGVLKVLEQEGLDFVGISGNSMGSLVGGVYAAGYSSAQIESIALSADWNRLFSSQPAYGAQYLQEKQQAERYILRLRHNRFLPYLPGGLIPLQNVELLLNRLLAEIEFNTGYDFDRLAVPYRAVAVDIRAGRKVVLKSGRLEQAIRASIAIPGVFSPEVIEGRELVDGGVLDYLPVTALDDFQPDFIIAVLTMRRQESPDQSLLDVASRSIDLMSIANVEQARQRADVVIEPDVSRFLHSDFARARELIAAGESAALRALPVIRERLKGRVPVRSRKRIEPRSLPVVRRVIFEGLKQTRRSLLLPYLRTREGARLNFGLLLGDLERLFNTGLFEDVNFRLGEVTAESADVIFEVNERPFGFYAFGVRYDNYDNVVVGAEVGEENILGFGATVRAGGVVGNPNEFRLGVTGTRIFQLPLGYRIDGYISSLSRSLWEQGRFGSSYFVRVRGVVTEAGYSTGRNGFFNFGARVERIGYEGMAVETLPSGLLAGLRANLEFNTFDRLELPGRGLGYRLSGFYSSPKVLSRFEFLKAEFADEQVVPLSARWALRWWSDIGLVLGRPPFSEQFLSGGERFAGFAPEEFVSEQRLIAGSALRWRVLNLLSRDDYPVYLEAGVNAGTFARPDSLLLSDRVFEQLHWGAGFGVMTNTPAGPLKLIVGLGNFFKPTPHPGGVRIYLSLGKEFRYRR